MPVPGVATPASPGVFFLIGRMIVKTAIERFIRHEFAVSTIEYALLAGLIAVVILISVSAAGTQLQSLFNYVSSQVAQAMS